MTTKSSKKSSSLSTERLRGSSLPEIMGSILSKAHRERERILKKYGYKRNQIGTLTRCLIISAQAGDQSSWQDAIALNCNLVMKFAVKCIFMVDKYPNLSLEDLYQEGVFGIIHAIDKYDTSSKWTFSTYSSAWIRHYIRRYVTTHGPIIRVPEWLDAKIKFGDTEKPLSEKAEKLKRLALDSINVQAIVNNDGELFPIAAEENDDIGGFDTEIVRAVLSTLPDRSRTILWMRMKGMKLWEIGANFQMTEERIRQIEVHAIKQLKKYIQIKNNLAAVALKLKPRGIYTGDSPVYPERSRFSTASLDSLR